METITNSFPQQRVMIGRVVSIVVAPPAEMGARRPKYLTNNGAQRYWKESNNRILRLLPCNRSVNDGSGTG